jgi:hypothetical protein
MWKSILPQHVYNIKEFFPALAIEENTAARAKVGFI